MKTCLFQQWRCFNRRFLHFSPASLSKYFNRMHAGQGQLTNASPTPSGILIPVNPLCSNTADYNICWLDWIMWCTALLLGTCVLQYVMMLQWNCVVPSSSSSHDTGAVRVEVWGRSYVVQATFMDCSTLVCSTRHLTQFTVCTAVLVAVLVSNVYHYNEIKIK